jgi:Ribbon-helix-helix protein, copG family
MMTSKKTHGRTRDGRPLTDELIEELVANAEHGYEPDQMTVLRRGGRPTMGSGPSSVESVRLDPELDDALSQRTEQEGRSKSEIIRDALRQYLEAS